MQHIRSIIVCAVVCIYLSTSRHAGAAQIKYVIQGVGSGQTDSAPFTNQPFTLTMLADTNNIQTGSFYIAVNNDSVSLDMLGVTYTGFAGSSFVFPQPTLPTYAGFTFVQALVGTDWDSGNINIYNLAFQTYDLKTEVGPLTLPTTSPPAGSPLYLNLFTDTNGLVAIQTLSQATFQAILVPEPATLLLVTLGATLLTRRRQRPSDLVSISLHVSI